MPHLKSIDGSMRTVSNVPSRKGCLASLVVFALLLLGVTGLLWAETATLTGTSVMLAFKPGASYDAWIHSMAADGTMSEAQGARFTVPAAPVDVAPANPTGLTVQ